MSSTATTERPGSSSESQRRGSSGSVLREIMSGNGAVTVLAIVLSLIISGLLIIVTNSRVTEAAGYFFSRPSDTFAAAWKAVSDAYAALFRGSLFNYRADTLTEMIRPFTETLTVATPLIIISLGVAIAFRSGLFNIGGQGQMIFGAMFATWFGTHLQLPWGIHLLLVIIMGILGGALWGGIVGVLKAWTGAHEVILTIMLNYVAINLVTYLLYTPVLQREGSTNPVSGFMEPTAVLPTLFSPYRLHWGFIIAILATLFTWWLMNRSTIGFRLRAVGANPSAARTAGVSVPSMYVVAMAISGGLAGLAGMAQVSGTEKVLNTDVAGSFGFDAITVALLGRSNPIGVFFAGLLFGALRAGGVAMQVDTGVPVDIVLVVQSFIVLFIAAPPLVRMIFRLPQPGVLKARMTADPVTQPLAAGVAAATTATADGTTAHAPEGAAGEGSAVGHVDEALEADDTVAAPPLTDDPDDGPPLGSHSRAEDLSQQDPASRRDAAEGDQL